MPSRLRVPRSLAAAAALVLGARTDAPAPLAPPAPTEAPSRQASAATPRHVLRLTGNAADLERQVAALGGAVTFRHAGARVAIVEGLSDEAARALAAVNGVGDVQPDVTVTLARPAGDAPVVPLDAAAGDVTIASQANPATAIRYSWQWNMRAIGAQHAWAAGKLGSPNVTVAILDTGIDYNSLDANGLVDLARSASFVPSDDALRAAFFPARHVSDDFNGHGTNVASQVSSMGVAHAGVTSRTRLMSVKVLGASGSGSIAGILQGVLYAADHGADVINMSLGTFSWKSGGGGPVVALFNQTFAYANRAGALVVVASGNDGMDLDRNLVPTDDGIVRVPSLYSLFCDSPHVVCVGASGPVTFTGPSDLYAAYSNFGRSAISLSAPGGNVGSATTAWPWGNGTVSWVWSMCPKSWLPNPATPNVRPCAGGGSVNGAVGTSQAAPHVAGLAALLIAERGRGNPAAIKAALMQSADDAGAPGMDAQFGHGRINVARALGL
ncbi:S8 family serine peptidase [Roseisolibacter sp. H3M3-2]|uniref:S8 family serine peptidase n=1 Tax=Roseisolibacter sp. H3M3-2 TaxID=3031323 RepID=UPI0023DB85BC|nr:S8 family serine peptidase [Roseisolibacter sp. H3M3-2]MDF1504452.1 S8 family serine peptidase [Roseisolibacter sp. H3M3-2]